MNDTGSTTGRTTASSESGRTGRGNGRGEGRGGNRQRRGGRGGRGPHGRLSTPSRFKGATADMGGNVFECYDELHDPRQYEKTIEALHGYANKTMRFAEDIDPLFADPMVAPQLVPPKDPPISATKTEELLWTESIKEYAKRTRELRGNLATLHAVIWGQCSEAMRSRIKSLNDYQAKTGSRDCFWLLKQIKGITLQFDERKNGFISLLDARTSFLNCRQTPQQTADVYLDTLRGWANAIEYYGGTVAENYELVSKIDDDGHERTIDQRKSIARDRTLAIALVRGADTQRYGTLITELSNQYAMGIDNYPTDLTAAHGLLVNYKTPTNTSTRTHHHRRSESPMTAPEASGMTFAQTAPVPGISGITHSGITCFNCNEVGHYASDCPACSTSGTNGTTLVQCGFNMTQAEEHGTIPTNWILLDSQSTISVFKNADMLRNIRPSSHTLCAYTNGGYQDSTQLGDFPNLGPVWYNPQSIANILALSDVRKICRVTMDTAAATAMCVHRVDGTVMRFVEQPSGLYVYKASGTVHPNGNTNPTNTTNETVTAYSFLKTVRENQSIFSQRQIASADQARALYRKLGRPSEAEFQRILRNNFLRNCPVTPDDASRALLIYGPDTAALKGKMTRTPATPHIPDFRAVPLPVPIAVHHHRIVLCVDFFVQGLPFFHTISRTIGFRTVAPVTDRSKSTVLRELRAAIKLYTARGLTVTAIHGDHEFECVRADFPSVSFDIVPHDSHVGEVERSIRTIKERIRSTAHGLPFKRLPRVLLRAITSHSVHCLNQFPWSLGVSQTLSPAGIVTGAPLPDYTHLSLELGSYVQFFDDHEPTNEPRACSIGAIALHPTGNATGAYYFMSLATGARLSRRGWTELPIPDTAIARVETLALHEGQPLLQHSGLVVEWRHDQPIDDSKYDASYQPPPAPPTDEALDADFAPVLTDELAQLHHDLALPVPDAPAVAAAAPPLVQGANDGPNHEGAELHDAIENDELENEGAELHNAIEIENDDDENDEFNDNDTETNDENEAFEDESTEMDSGADVNKDEDPNTNEGAPPEANTMNEGAPDEGANEGAPNEGAPPARNLRPH